MHLFVEIVTQIIIYFLSMQIFVEYVVRNPQCELGKPITSELFQTKLDEYIRGLSIFPTRIS